MAIQCDNSVGMNLYESAGQARQSLSLIFVNQDKIESVVRFESRSQRTIDSTRLSRELSKTTEQRNLHQGRSTFTVRRIGNVLEMLDSIGQQAHDLAQDARAFKIDSVRPRVTSCAS